MPTSSKRTRRDQRRTTPPPMVLMPRDVEIIRAVAAFRVLRQDQLQQLFFGSRSTAQYRLSRLYQHEFLERVFLPVRSGSSPTLYLLGKRGVELLRAEGDEERKPYAWGNGIGHEYLAHTLAINDVRLHITLACQQLGYTMLDWRDEGALKADYDRVTIRYPSGTRTEVSLIPDSYAAVATPHGTAHFFLELDRGTMTVQRFQTKILAYQAYVESGVYQHRYHTTSLRVLTVTNSSRRLMNLKQAAEAVHGGHLFWFATLNQITSEAVLTASFWHVAGSSENTVLIPTK